MSKFYVYLNDPHVPVKRPLPANMAEAPPSPAFSVQGFPDNQQSAQVYFFIRTALEAVNRNLTDPIGPWAAVPTLVAYPRSGTQMNAYYDRQSLRFFYQSHPETGKTVYTCESSDVVTHELGHAVLDALRPDLWSNPAIEISSLHEAFGDCLAILATLCHDEIIAHLIAETQGDLRLQNAVCRIAEEMGNAVYHLFPSPGRSPDCLRNACNSFTYVDPETLPNRAPDNMLSKSAHSFGRVFTGAFYDALVLLFDDAIAAGTSPQEAVVAARDHLGRALLNGIRAAFLAPKMFQNVAYAMMTAHPPARSAIGRAFAKKKIIPVPEAPLLSSPLVQKESSDPMVVRLADFHPESDNPLYACQVELPASRIRGVVTAGPPPEDAVAAAKSAVDYLAATDRVCYNSGPESAGKEFRVENGCLVRNFFSCCPH